MTPLALIAVNVIVAVGSWLQGSVGFGLGLLAVPFLALIDTALVPGPILFASGCLTVTMLRRERDALRRDDLKWSLGGRVFGTLAAMAVLVAVPAERLGVLFGVLVLGAVALSASGLHPATGPRTLVSAGLLSGFMATVASIGGPPMALLYQRESGASIRSTLSAYFLVGTVISLGGLYLVDRFGWLELRLGLLMLPGTWLGFAVSRWTTGLFDRGLIRPAILVVSAIAGAAVAVKTLW